MSEESFLYLLICIIRLLERRSLTSFSLVARFVSSRASLLPESEPDPNASHLMRHSPSVSFRCKEGFQGIRCDQFLPKTDSILSDPSECPILIHFIHYIHTFSLLSQFHVALMLKYSTLVGIHSGALAQVYMTRPASMVTSCSVVFD